MKGGYTQKKPHRKRSINKRTRQNKRKSIKGGATADKNFAFFIGIHEQTVLKVTYEFNEYGIPIFKGAGGKRLQFIIGDGNAINLGGDLRLFKAMTNAKKTTAEKSPLIYHGTNDMEKYDIRLSGAHGMLMQFGGNAFCTELERAAKFRRTCPRSGQIERSRSGGISRSRSRSGGISRSRSRSGGISRSRSGRKTRSRSGRKARSRSGEIAHAVRRNANRVGLLAQKARSRIGRKARSLSRKNARGDEMNSIMEIKELESLRMHLYLIDPAHRGNIGHERLITNIDNIPLVFNKGNLCKMTIEYLDLTRQTPRSEGFVRHGEKPALKSLFSELFYNDREKAIIVFNTLFKNICIMKNYDFNWSNTDPQKWLESMGYTRDTERCSELASSGVCEGQFGITEIYEKSLPGKVPQVPGSTSYDGKLSFKRFRTPQDTITHITPVRAYEKLGDMLNVFFRETIIAFKIRATGKINDPGKQHISEIKKVLLNLPNSEFIMKMVAGGLTETDALYFPSILMEDAGNTLDYYFGKWNAGEETNNPGAKKIATDNLYGWQLGLAQGLRYMNDNDYYHQDIKPENICAKNIGTAYIIKIIDFGLTLKIDEKAAVSEKQRMGTRLYKYYSGCVNMCDCWAYMIMIAYMNLKASLGRSVLMRANVLTQSEPRGVSDMLSMYETLFTEDINNGVMVYYDKNSEKLVSEAELPISVVPSMLETQEFMVGGVPNKERLWKIFRTFTTKKEGMCPPPPWDRIIEAQQ